MDAFVKQGIIFDYDDEADVLYVTDPTKNEDPVGEMTDEGIIIRRNSKTNEVCGITILNFMKRVKEEGGVPTDLIATWQVV